MSFFSVIFDSIAATNEKRARVVALQALRDMPARNLADLGFDPVLLDKGVKGWPWRVQESDDLAEMKMVWGEGSRFQAQYDKCEAERNAAAKCSSEEEFRAEEQKLAHVA